MRDGELAQGKARRPENPRLLTSLLIVSKTYDSRRCGRPGEFAGAGEGRSVVASDVAVVRTSAIQTQSARTRWTSCIQTGARRATSRRPAQTWASARPAAAREATSTAWVGRS